MKKLTVLLTALICCTASVPAVYASEDVQTERVIITSKTDTEIEVPEYADELYISFCPSLETVTLPRYVDEIYITDCPSLKEVNVAEDNMNFCSVDGIVYTKDMTEVVFCPQAKEGAEFVIPDGVIKIRENAFNYCTFESYVLPDSLEEMGNRAFYDNFNLRKINIPEKVNGTLFSVFAGCNNLKEIAFENDSDEINGYRTFSSFDLDIPYLNALDGVNDVQIAVYVPDNKITDYHMILGINSDNIIILPISTKKDDSNPFDVNGDGIVSISDAVAMQSYLLGGTVENIGNTDIDGDGRADVFDFLLMKKIIIDNWADMPY
ncbi:MAG: leucine-rich repeat protein [Ruminococcus flavefaciens]|nr:leucine-rich repeat protein [Ruminococcus flavefaciens]MCM1228728.1 leucine-rich repeat protein [Ruminococcus flavefaciens]